MNKRVRALFVPFAYCIALLASYQLRSPVPLDWWFTDPAAQRVASWAILYGVLGWLVEMARPYRGAWRYTSAREVVGLTLGTTVAATLFTSLVFIIDRGHDLPRPVVMIAWMLSLLIVVGMRPVVRISKDASLLKSLAPWEWGQKLPTNPVLVIGSLGNAERFIRLLLADPGRALTPVAVMTNDRSDGERLHGLPCLGKVIDK